MSVYKDKDFVRVTGPDGVVLPDLVPKAWVGTDLLPEGSKEATRAQAAKSDAEVKADAVAAEEARIKADAEAKAIAEAAAKRVAGA